MKVLDDTQFYPWGGKLYPSGEFVLWRKRRETKRQQEEGVYSAGLWLLGNRDLGDVFEMFGPSFVYRWWNAAARLDLPGVRASDPHSVIPSVEEEGEGGPPPLGLSALANSKKRRRGLGGLTSHGKVIVREAASGLEKSVGRSVLSFWTCTLPRLSPEDTEAVCSNWSAILNNLRQKLQYHLEAAGLPPHIVGVTELQTSRYEKEGYPGWHIHWVFQGRKPGQSWALPPTLLDKLWQEAVEKWCSRRYSWRSASNVQRVKKSVAGYLSKYLSKGGVVGRLVEEGRSSFVPSSWYTCTNGLKKWVKVNTLQSEDIARWLYQRLLDDIGSIVAPWAFKLETRPGCSIAVCWLGRILDPPSPRVDLGTMQYN